MNKEDLKYTEEHEWLYIEDEVCTIGITDFAQGELGDIVFIELPDDGTKVKLGQSAATIEAVKTVADVYAPISGEIIDSNQSLIDTPELINSNPFDKGWIIKIKLDNSETFPEFMTCKEYEDFINK